MTVRRSMVATGPGTGTVTDVSVTTHNGISGTVATSTTTPAISLSLGQFTYGTGPAIIGSPSAAVHQFGGADVATSTPVAQTLTFQGVGYATNVAGTLATIKGAKGGSGGSPGDGGELRLIGGLAGAAAGTGGAITFYTAPLASGTTAAVRMTIPATGEITIPGTLTIGAGSAITSSGAGGALGTAAFTAATAYLPANGVGMVAPTYTVGTLPTPVVAKLAYVSDGDPSLNWGDTVINSTTTSATKYLVWYNGSDWTVAGK